ncbi:uncharacterized protein FIESC28_09470 [Fusarium coffeatum]|uniref:N-acetyltransferase domain-containing protein n=1 Tax=Fusarium coffeatum TaxID=231269 RepID=A0A366R2N6_9HYPO|nr:uncharacterized protein FIESC28_09470 [Fusarium coffeatum]RBR10475.1 hypothetical protein FIESC28_09470 [Fusarium coffeatum]
MESSKPSIKIVRIGSLEEVYELIDLACDSFADDLLYSLILPTRKQNPEVFQKTWSSNLREEYGKKGAVILAARRDDGGERSEFVGFAVWVRYGTSYLAQSWQGDTWDKQLMRIKTTWEHLYETYISRPDPNLVNTEALNDLLAGAGVAEKLYPKERWGLTWLGVSSKCQGAGVGRRLAQWGIDRSEEEGVPAGLVSSTPGLPLYEKLGFRVIGRSVYDREGNSMPVMLREVEKRRTI